MSILSVCCNRQFCRAKYRNVIHLPVIIFCSYISIHPMSVTVWRHVDKTGPEGNIDALLQHGQGVFFIAVDFTELLVFPY